MFSKCFQRFNSRTNFYSYTIRFAHGFSGGGGGGLSPRALAAAYRALNLEPGSSQDLVRRAYVAMVKKFHPDKQQGDSTKFQEIDQV